MYLDISYFVEVIFTNCMWKILAVMGIGAGVLAIYKMQNPECMHDMKKTLDNITETAGKKMKNMME